MLRRPWILSGSVSLYVLASIKSALCRMALRRCRNHNSHTAQIMQTRLWRYEFSVAWLIFIMLLRDTSIISHVKIPSPCPVKRALYTHYRMFLSERMKGQFFFFFFFIFVLLCSRLFRKDCPLSRSLDCVPTGAKTVTVWAAPDNGPCSASTQQGSWDVAL